MIEDQDEGARQAAEEAQSEFTRTSEAFDTVRGQMLEAIASSRIGETALREKLYMGISVIESVRTAVLTVAAGAPLADMDELIARIQAGDDPG